MGSVSQVMGLDITVDVYKKPEKETFLSAQASCKKEMKGPLSRGQRLCDIFSPWRSESKTGEQSKCCLFPPHYQAKETFCIHYSHYYSHLNIMLVCTSFMVLKLWDPLVSAARYLTLMNHANTSICFQVLFLQNDSLSCFICYTLFTRSGRILKREIWCNDAPFTDNSGKQAAFTHRAVLINQLIWQWIAL